MTRLCTLVAGFCVLLLPSASPAWDVICRTDAGVDCPDPFSRARTHWTDHPRAEHRRLLEQTITLAGLPASFQLPFELTVFTVGGTVQGQASYPVVRPVRTGAKEEQTRELSIPAMASLPDFSYSLWDWASGNELCPPDSSNTDALDCHNYETHIGWLNSNHMLPQARRFYEHLHRLAIARARECKALFDQLSGLHIDRFADYVRACEQAALVVEAVAQHYLQDAWATGHMWERWGGAEIRDFDFDRAHGFGIATLTGLIHGGKAALDDSPFTSPFGPWDDPMNAPHPDDSYVDGVGGVLHPGIGDRFLAELRGTVSTSTDYGPQRRALLGCAVDGLRAVYGETAQFTGPMGAANTTEADPSRRVTDGSCWDQRTTNRAVGAGCGIHRGAYPNQLPIELDVTGTGFILMLAETTIAPLVANAPPLTGDRLEAYRADAAYACSEAKAMAADPTTADGTEMASGGLPAVLGVLPNSHFARGNASTLPADWADPFLPWSLAAVGDPAIRIRKEALNLTFADAHVTDRCRDLAPADLDGYRLAVSEAPNDAVRATRCRQCEQIVTPHLRFGRVGEHDTRREALCGFAGPLNAAFAYTGEDPAGFTGGEPGDLPAVRNATRVFCGCETTTTTTTTTSTTLPPTVSVFPPSALLEPGETMSFFADAPVTWSATGGAIDADGLYTAGAALGSHAVTAQSVPEPSLTGTAPVTITQLDLPAAYCGPVTGSGGANFCLCVTKDLASSTFQIQNLVFPCTTPPFRLMLASDGSFVNLFLGFNGCPTMHFGPSFFGTLTRETLALTAEFSQPDPHSFVYDLTRFRDGCLN